MACSAFLRACNRPCRAALRRPHKGGQASQETGGKSGLSVDYSDLAGEYRLCVDAHRYDDVYGHVGGLAGIELHGDGCAVLHTDVDRLVAVGGHEPNLVVRDEGGDGGVLGAGDYAVLKRHETDAHVLAQITVSGPLGAQHGSKSSVEVDGAGIDYAGGQSLSQSGGMTHSNDGAIASAVDSGESRSRSHPVGAGVGFITGLVTPGLHYRAKCGERLYVILLDEFTVCECKK